MKEFLITNWSELALAISTVFAWFGGKKHLLNNQAKKSQAAVTESNISNVTATLDVYKEALDDLEIRFKARISDVEDDLLRMKILNDDLRKVIGNNEKYIKKLQVKLKNYEELER